MAEPNVFGVTTAQDFFNLGKVNFKPIDSSKEPRAQNIESAQDASEDYVATSVFGNSGGTVFEVSTTYQLCSGTLAVATDLKLGEIEAGVAVTSIAITTGNGAVPTVVVSGFIGLKKMVAPDGKANTFTLPAWTLNGAKIAQPLGFTVSKGHLTGCGATLECELYEAADGMGEPCANAVSAARGTVTAEFVASTELPAWSVSQANSKVTKALGQTAGQAAYHTTDGAYIIDLPRAGAE